MNPMTSTQSPFFQKNIDALQRKQPQLASRLIQLPDNPMFFFAQGGDGSPIIGLRLENGKNVALCDAKTPGVEAEDWVLSLGEPMLKGGHTILLGFGSAYHPHAFFQLSDNNTFLWFVEPDLHMFKYALHLMDYTLLISSPRTGIAVAMQPDEVTRQLFEGPTRHRMMTQGVQMAFHGVAAHLYKDYIRQLQSTITEAVQLNELKFRTSEQQGKEVLQNCLSNLEAVLQGSPFLYLQGKAAGMPALVVSPGPSLEEALSFIKRIKNQVLIVAVDTAHRILHQNGIASDFVVSLDYTELNARHFESIGQEDAYLLAFPGVNPQIPKKYLGRTFFYDHLANIKKEPGATLLFHNLKSIGPLGSLISYGSTAHAAYHAARLMGCTPIVLVGNDLAYPNDKHYATGALQNELEKDEGCIERLEVPANDGSTVITRGIYKSYLVDFSPLIRATAGNVVNTASRGAKIEACRFEALDQVIKQFSLPIDKSFIQQCSVRKLENKRSALVEELKQISRLCSETSQEVKRLAKKIRYLDPNDLNFHNELMKTVKAFIQLNQREGYMILDLASSLCSRSIVSVIGQFGDAGRFSRNTPENSRQIHQKIKELMKDIDEALTLISRSINETLRSLPKPNSN